MTCGRLRVADDRLVAIDPDEVRGEGGPVESDQDGLDRPVLDRAEGPDHVAMRDQIVDEQIGLGVGQMFGDFERLDEVELALEVERELSGGGQLLVA